MLIWRFLLCLVILAPSITGCRSGRAAQDRLTPKADGNFILHVSNQSAAISPVDIEIRIDGRLAVKGEFHYKDGHHWQQYQFQTSAGEHILTATSEKGHANFEERFSIKDKHWAVVNYFGSPGKKMGVKVEPIFTFLIGDEPIYFH